jgi:ABC-type uncharacterized transport system permease subunit
MISRITSFKIISRVNPLLAIFCIFTLRIIAALSASHAFLFHQQALLLAAYNFSPGWEFAFGLINREAIYSTPSPGVITVTFSLKGFKSTTLNIDLKPLVIVDSLMPAIPQIVPGLKNNV